MISNQELYNALCAESMPEGFPRVIPATSKMNANVSPLTEQGDNFWSAIVHVKGTADEEVRAAIMTRLAMIPCDHWRAQLIAYSYPDSQGGLWWEGRQCFWWPHREHDFIDVCKRLKCLIIIMATVKDVLKTL